MQLLPRFSLRSTLLAAVVVALLALFVREAVAGKMWAQAVSVALASIVGTLAVHVVFFAIVRGFAAVGGISDTEPLVRTKPSPPSTVPPASKES